MQQKNSAKMSYTVEREFSGKITTTELIGRIAKAHINIYPRNEESMKKTLENAVVCSRIKTGKTVEG